MYQSSNLPKLLKPLVVLVFTAALTACATAGKTPQELAQLTVDKSGQKVSVKAKEKLEKLAEGGNADAQLQLANMYEFGRGVRKDNRRSLEWHKKLADEGSSDSLYKLGKAYLSGSGYSKNIDLAADYFRKAAKLDNDDAQANLGWLHYFSRLDNSQRTKALEWFQKAADNEHGDGYAGLGFMRLDGDQKVRDYKIARSLFEKGVNKSSKKAQAGLAHLDMLDGDYISAFNHFIDIGDAEPGLTALPLSQLFFSGLGTDQNIDVAVRWLKLAADNGSFLANRELAFLAGLSNPPKWIPLSKDKYNERFLKLARKDATAGSSSAHFYLGLAYFSGRGVTKDDAKVVEYHKLTDEINEQTATVLEALMYEFGVGRSQNFRKARNLYGFVEGVHSIESKYRLGQLLARGDGGAKDISKAFELIFEAAESGHERAQLSLIEFYKKGIGTEKDIQKTIPLLIQLANKGDDISAVELSYLFRNGEHVKQDYGRSLKWANVAADAGNVEGMTLAAYQYEHGNGVNQNYSMAASLYQKAANKDDDYAQASLGRLYLVGDGVSRDANKALALLRKAVKKDNSFAQHLMGVVYENGIDHIKPNMESAVNYYWKAANNNEVESQYRLAQIYQDGRGVPQSASAALEWYQRAADNGHANAQAFLAGLSDYRPPQKSPNSAVPDASGSGTGWLSEYGLIVTNHHVVDGGTNFRIQFPDKNEYALQVIAVDKVNDLALLEVKGNTGFKKGIRVSENPASLGEDVVAIGFPLISTLGIEPKLTTGTVSSMAGRADDPRNIQISAPLQPGNSGGPVLSSEGEVIGIVVSGLQEGVINRIHGHYSQNVNYAVKSRFLKKLFAEAGSKKSLKPVVLKRNANTAALAKAVVPLVGMVLVD